MPEAMPLPDAMHMPQNPPHRIDVHHHLYPPVYLKRLTDRKIAQKPALDWSPARAIEDMDRGGIAAAITSLTAPALEMLEREELRLMARECNDYAARLAADHPGRFGIFATLPLPDLDGALREIAYAFDVLQADGVCLLTSYENKWLGDAAFAPLLEELNRRKAVAYVHPTAPECCRNLLPGIPDWVVEYPTDTTRTIISLLYSGAAARYPDIRFIFSHCGGTMPFISQLIERAALASPTLAAAVPDGAHAALCRFHYDTALRAHPTGMASMRALMGASQWLFGTDFPFRTSHSQIDGLGQCGFSEAEMRQIDCENAHTLMPRWKPTCGCRHA